MIETQGGVIAARSVPASALPIRRGALVARELGRRLLVRYMLVDQVGRFAAGSAAEHFVTPTPLAGVEANAVLALPAPKRIRRFALLLDPALITEIKGPRWVRWGTGIEYILPRGFPARAVASTWEIRI
ncbi:MAG: hypothetical protein M3340_02525 [Actinomycetota bacterium]|nr:hypothetical protein [Actinomycetota bacterium]